MKDYYDYERAKATDDRMRDPNTPDNLDVRLAIMARVRSGEITLAQGQAELAEIKRKGKAAGKVTAYRE